MVRWIFGAVAALILSLGAIIGLRMGMHKSASATAAVTLAAPPVVNAQAAASHLSAAIKQKTISTTPGVVDEPAAFEGLEALLAQTYPLTHARFTKEKVEGHSLLFTLPGSDPALPALLLLAHQDVVPVDPVTADQWQEAPFDGTIKDGLIWGRGSMDDKGSLIAIMEATEALLAKGFTPKRTLILAFGHDEEVKGAGAAAMAALLTARGIKVWFALDEGMAVVQSFPLTKAPVALIGIAEKGYMTVRVTATGAGGHSSMPPKDSAVDRLARALAAIRGRPFPGGAKDGPAAALLDGLYPNLPPTTQMAVANRWAFGGMIDGQLSASAAGDALARTTIAPTMLGGGVKENVLPQQVHAIINLRLHPRDTPDSALAYLRESAKGIEGVSIEPEGEPNAASKVSAADGPAFALLAAAAKAHSPENAGVAPMLVLGATDSRHYAEVAENTYRFFPMWVSDEDLGRIHGVNERLAVADLERMIKFYAQLIETGTR